MCRSADVSGGICAFDLGGWDAGVFLDLWDNLWVMGSPGPELRTFFPANTWVYIVVTRSGSAVKLYANGVIRTSLNVSGVLNASNKALVIGNATHQAGFFRGNMADFRLYKDVIIDGTVIPNGPW